MFDVIKWWWKYSRPNLKRLYQDNEERMHFYIQRDDGLWYGVCHTTGGMVWTDLAHAESLHHLELLGPGRDYRGTLGHYDAHTKQITYRPISGWRNVRLFTSYEFMLVKERGRYLK